MKTKTIALPAWSAKDRKAAESEGWNLFAVGAMLDSFRIYRDDRAKGPHMRGGQPVPETRVAQVFKDDRQAMAFVRRRASEGSDLHQRALRTVEISLGREK